MEMQVMRKPLWMLLGLLPAAAAAIGCQTGDDDDATVVEERSPIIVEVSPEPSEDNFFYQSDLWVEFDVAPMEATVALADSAGSALDAAVTAESSGRRLRLDPAADLVPSTSYTMTVTWSTVESATAAEYSPLTVNFQTGPYGNSVTNADDLIGKTFNIDLTSATFVEPPGVGPILQSQIGDIAILFSMTGDSNFDAAAQPGLHIIGALGDVEGGSVTQDICNESLAFTYGPDNVLGGGDDVPAEWADPVLVLGPTNLDISVQGISAQIQDLFISGTFHPNLDDMQGGTFSGKVDTRPLAPELDPEGGKDAICELVSETVGVECEECGGENPGPYCLSVLAEDIVAAQIPDLVLQSRNCVDILGDAGCTDNWGDYDVDGDGVYEVCPDFQGGGDDDDSSGDDDDSAL
jgi:hypothetical protein